MKNGMLAVLVAGTLLLAPSGSTLAAGKMGSAGGIDEFGALCPALTAGKMGGAGGVDEFGRSVSVESEGGKIGGGMDRCDRVMRRNGLI